MLNRLRRVTTDGSWIPEVDGLRFLAIFSVILFHMSLELSERSGRPVPIEPRFWWLGRILGNGASGVWIFFVISGMILALPFARHYLVHARPVSLRKYYLRRLTRLEPPYIASIALAVLMLFVYQRGLLRGSLPHVLATIFYQHSLIYRQMSTVNPVTWSLEIEIQFYLLAPLLMQVFRIRRVLYRRAVLVAAIAFCALAQMPFADSPAVNLSILGYLHFFVTGLLIADIFVLDLPGIQSSWIWDILGAAALAAIFWVPGDQAWPLAVLPIPIALLFIAVMRSKGLRRFFSNQWIAVIGGMCYSIYLLHFLMIAMLFKVTRLAIVPGALFVINFGTQLVVTVVPMLVLCTIFYILVERPCMNPNWPVKLWHAVNRNRRSAIASLDASKI